MALTESDRNLLQRCLTRAPEAWKEFVDRFLGLIVHVVNHAATARAIRLTPQDGEDLAADVLLTLVSNDFAVLRRFRGESSLATYLTVIARRVVVRELLKRKPTTPLSEANGGASHDHAEERIGDRDEVARLLSQLAGPEADVVRLYHLEGKSYQEISAAVGMPENSVGPTLSRARAKLRQVGADSAAN